MKSVSIRSMMRCFRTTRSAATRPVAVRRASLLLAALDEPFDLQPLQHLARRCAATRCSISATRAASVGEPDGLRPVLADGKARK